MAKKFEPGPADKHAEAPKQNEKADKRSRDELEEGLEDSFPASDPPSSTQPSRSKSDA
jgi:hypothetical protein